MTYTLHHSEHGIAIVTVTETVPGDPVVTSMADQAQKNQQSRKRQKVEIKEWAGHEKNVRFRMTDSQPRAPDRFFSKFEKAACSKFTCTPIAPFPRYPHE